MWVLVAATAAATGQDIHPDVGKNVLRERVKLYSQGALLEESIAAGQAQVLAESDSSYELELRPGASEDHADLALRIYLPSFLQRGNLRERLKQVTEEERLRIAGLEWIELMDVYRSFCEYRMLQKQELLYDQELVRLTPYLEKADEAVSLSQLSIMDRAKLYSFYLELVNDHENIKADLSDLDKKLRLLLGAETDLARMAEMARVDMPSRMEFERMINLALESRPDYQQFDARIQSLVAAEKMARAEEGFRLKYIQPDYRVDHQTGESRYGISASFTLPWGNRNSDRAVYARERALSQSAMVFKRTLIEHRLRVLLQTTATYYEQDQARAARVEPLVRQLKEDLEVMKTGRLEDLRDQLIVWERIFEVSLQATRVAFRKEQMAVDLAAELGTLPQN